MRRIKSKAAASLETFWYRGMLDRMPYNKKGRTDRRSDGFQDIIKDS
jgi:hypothetical protein